MKRIIREHGMLKLTSRKSGRSKFFNRRSDAAQFLRRLRRLYPSWNINSRAADRAAFDQTWEASR